jgi:peptidoglycan/xylan/chitin deacetylase (PgdA/CDA1 family)
LHPPQYRRATIAAAARTAQMDQTPTRRTVSRAGHHRRRRLVAVLVLAGFVVLAAVALRNPGGGGSHSRSPQEHARALQAERAAATLERRSPAHRAENAAIMRILRRESFVRVAGRQTRSVALTFDDGPGPYTGRILDTLHRFGAKATFFTLGMEAGRHQLELHRALADGHAIGNHSWGHADLTEGAAARARLQILDANAALVAAGAPRPRLFRPPYGAYDRRLLRIARELAMLTVMWSVDASDYKATSARRLAAAVLADTRPGSIILMHDGGGDRTVTARAMPLIVRGLKRRGLRMVTVPRLLMDNPPPERQDRVGRIPRA